MAGAEGILFVWGGGEVAKAGIIERVGVCFAFLRFIDVCVCPCCGGDLIHSHEKLVSGKCFECCEETIFLFFLLYVHGGHMISIFTLYKKN